jgi:hypothetical protein
MPLNLCGACGEPALQACSRCKIVVYCAPACQALDWVSHKGACKTAAAAVTTAPSTAGQSSSTSAITSFGLRADDCDCGQPAVLRCSGCLGAFYCGGACQKRAWKQHKKLCKVAGEVIARMECKSFDDLDMKFMSYKLSAEAGDAVAQVNFGNCYSNGSGAAVDKIEASKWYKRAAEGGDAIAQTTLGDCYSNGDGVAVDKTEAFKWYKRAAEAGHDSAQNRLAFCYSFGEGVALDEAEGLAWWKRAAEAGNLAAKICCDFALNEDGVLQAN